MPTTGLPDSHPPKKHGFYSRNAIESNFSERIDIRRYRCDHCGKTISYLPGFAYPISSTRWRQFFFGLVGHFGLEFSLAVCIELLCVRRPGVRSKNTGSYL
jgi:hypothetical protein